MRAFSALGFFALLGVFPTGAPLPADDPLATKQEEAVVKLRRAAERAEVHAVSIYEPEHSRLGHVTGWPKLVEILRTKKGPAGRVWELLGEDAQKRVADDKLVRDLSNPKPGLDNNPIPGAVSGALRELLNKPDFYTEEAFKGVALTKELKDVIALGNKRPALQTARLNWALLNATFPGCIPELPARFRTVRVQVLAGSDVVLVLSSCERCRWEVTLREGAKVTGVVLCGYHAVEVAGVDAPVVYRAYYGPDGVTLSHPTDYFYAPPKEKERFTKEDEEKYKRFVDAIKRITGKELSSFQGAAVSNSDNEPYTVRPVAG